MHLKDLKQEIPNQLFRILEAENIQELRPCQNKAINKGLFQNKSLLICTPTASGKTLVAELASINNILGKKGKAVYIVPLKALASEKYKEFSKKYGDLINIALSIGDNIEKKDHNLSNADLIICTSEKLDSLMRFHVPWIKEVSTIIIDEIHLLNDPLRGPTLEIVITMLRQLQPKLQLIGLSATIGNPQELATWLNAELILDNWRPVKLKKGVFFSGRINFEK